MIRHEIKSQLAKLLATEDLVVENRPVETAQFNVHTRVLTLPQWERASSTVYDLLVGHEVGHALFTPDQDPPKGIPHSFLNIVEDARIEKLMKRKYMGLAKTFFKGYKQLSDEDFFCLEGEDVNKMNLADRANLWFKIGSHIDIPFNNDEEKDIIDMISNTETFADVIAAAEVLYKYCKEEKKKEKVDDLEQQPQQMQSGGKQGESQQPQSSDEGGEGSPGQQESSEESDDVEIDTSSSEEPEVHTAESLEENLKDLINQFDREYHYVEIPDLNLDTVIANNEEVHSYTTSFFKYYAEKRENPKVYDNVDSQFVNFKRSAQKEVNYLVKEFECKKAADSYARATTARTGVLDCSKLHTYKYNEDLFKKVTTLADGKNHGLVFILDWSGSMSNVLEDTLKQLYNLIWFCNKVNIPFDVYAFTGEWKRTYYDYISDKYVQADVVPHYEKRDGLLAVDDHFTLMNILTSKVSSKELEKQMINIWRIGKYFNSCVEYTIPERMSLSGTPLNESLVALRQILPKFQRENKLQKVQCIILTDGEANPLARHVEIEGRRESYIGCRRLTGETSFVRDRKLGTTQQVGYEWHKFSKLLLTNLKQNFPQVNFIGIRVLVPRDANSFIRMNTNGSKEQEKVMQDWKKNKSFCLRDAGYDAYFGLSSTALAQDTEFDVDEGATKAKIKSAFVKSLKTKKLNKKVLGEFISLVA